MMFSWLYHCVIIHLELLGRLLETLPGQESAPASELAMTNVAQAANDQSPGDQGQWHHREDPVKQPLQSNSLCTSLEIVTRTYKHRFPLNFIFTFFRRVLLGILIFITVVLTISPLSSDKLANRCLWSSLRQYLTNITWNQGIKFDFLDTFDIFHSLTVLFSGSASPFFLLLWLGGASTKGGQ